MCDDVSVGYQMIWMLLYIYLYTQRITKNSAFVTPSVNSDNLYNSRYYFPGSPINLPVSVTSYKCQRVQSPNVTKYGVFLCFCSDFATLVFFRQKLIANTHKL